MLESTKDRWVLWVEKGKWSPDSKVEGTDGLSAKKKVR